MKSSLQKCHNKQTMTKAQYNLLKNLASKLNGRIIDLRIWHGCVFGNNYSICWGILSTTFTHLMTKVFI